MKELEQALQNRILDVGETPLDEMIKKDERTKFVLLGTPTELIEEVTKAHAASLDGKASVNIDEFMKKLQENFLGQPSHEEKYLEYKQNLLKIVRDTLEGKAAVN